MIDIVTFPVYHWKTKELVDNVIMDYCFKCYYEEVPIYKNDHGYPFVYAKDILISGLKDIIIMNSNKSAKEIHQINYYIETLKWTYEGKNALHHRNKNKMDARIKNLEATLFGHEDRYFSKDQHDYREAIAKKMKGKHEQFTIS